MPVLLTEHSHKNLTETLLLTQVTLEQDKIAIW